MMIVATTTQIHGKTAEVTGVGVTAKAVVPPMANRGSLMLVTVAVKISLCLHFENNLQPC